MKLSELIRKKIELLLEQWDKSAEIIIPNAHKVDREALRDHAKQMLVFIAGDIERPQEEHEKEKQFRDAGKRDKSSPEESHGINRIELGLNLNQLVAEFRALRTNVTAIWSEENTELRMDNTEDLIRFNETMDELVGDAVASYSSRKEKETRILETMLRSSPDPIWILDPNGILVYVNESLVDLLEASTNELVGKKITELDMSSDTDLYKRILEVANTEEDYRGDVTIRLHSGKEKTYELVFTPVLDEEGKVEAIAGSSRDITERKAGEQQTWQAANFDLLTGIPNRRLFFDRLRQGLKDSERNKTLLALLFIDLDRFKEANDGLGHEGGDTLLKLAAERIGSCVRENDTVSRIGGDEFTVILKDVHRADEVRLVADKVRSELNRQFSIQGQNVQISGSIGIALYPCDGNEASTLVGAADKAMYTAKEAGGNKIRFYAPDNAVP